MKEISYNEKLKEVTEQLPKGAFLTIKAGDITNIMTVGWCMIGYMWNRPIFQILIRSSRYTYELLEKAGDFTVSFPINKDLNKELVYCGSHTGKKTDKVKESGLTLAPAMKINSPKIAECSLHYECKLVAKQKLPLEHLADGILYEEEDENFHMMFYGEIAACYTTDTL